MIRKPTDKQPAQKHIIVISGVPGIGKTTAALSSPNPLIINCDNNLHKVNPAHRIAPDITPETYQELISDLKHEDLSGYDTLIFDTAGELISLMKSWAIKLSPKNGTQGGAALSMQGWGVVKNEFESLLNLCMRTLQKHIVIVCHTIEKREEQGIIYRLDVEGSSSRFIWKKSELGGMMYVENGKRKIMFSPTEYHHAKSAFGIEGVREIPTTVSDSNNTFLTDLFQEADAYCLEGQKMIGEYEKLMEEVRAIISGVKSVKEANAVYEQFKSFKWLYAAKFEAWKILVDKAAGSGIEWDKESKKFIKVSK